MSQPLHTHTQVLVQHSYKVKHTQAVKQTVTLQTRRLDLEIHDSTFHRKTIRECGPRQNYSCDCRTNRILSSHSRLPDSVTRSSPNWIFICQCLYTPHLPHSMASFPDRKPLSFHFHPLPSPSPVHPISSFFTRGLDSLLSLLLLLLKVTNIKSN